RTSAGTSWVSSSRSAAALAAFTVTTNGADPNRQPRYKRAMGEEEIAVAQRAIDLWIAGDRDEAWAMWSEDCVGVPNRDWPEPGPWNGREKLRAEFQSWDTAFGQDWTTHLAVREMTDLGDGRVLLEIEFKASGVESGLPVDQELA